jgi:hypothetical protein
MLVGRRGEEVVVASRVKNADSGNHRTSRTPTLLQQPAGDRNSNPDAGWCPRSGLVIRESVSMRIAGLVGALRD